MRAKILTIAFAVALFAMGVGLNSVHAQTAPADAGAAAAPTDLGAPAGAFPEPALPEPGAPEAGVAGIEPPTAQVENPYGLKALWTQGDFVSHGVLFILAAMSLATWYIFVTKYYEQWRLLGQAKLTEKNFWSAANLEDGIDKLAKNNVFRSVAERGQQAMARQGGMLTQADWVQLSLARAVEEENARLGGGISFLASVGSTAPFVGLFGTVWGILNALTAIGIAGQASIDKVAGPVGEALIMTAVGLAVAVPAVLCYNLLVRRNKVLNEKFRSFASDLQTYLLSSKR